MPVNRSEVGQSIAERFQMTAASREILRIWRQRADARSGLYRAERGTAERRNTLSERIDVVFDTAVHLIE